MAAIAVLGILFTALALVAALGWVADSRPVYRCDTPADVFAPRH